MMFKLLLLLCVVMTMGYSKSVDPRPRVNFPSEVTNKVLQVIKDCLTEYNIDPKAVDEIRNGEYRDDVPFQNFIHCSYKNSGFAKEDGHLLIDDGIKIFPPESNVGPVLKKCDSLSKGDTPSEVTFNIFKCFQETSPVLMALSPNNQ